MAKTNSNTHVSVSDKTTKKTAKIDMRYAFRCWRQMLKEKEEKNQQSNPLALINVLLVLKPDKLFMWLGSEPNNPTKLSKFVATVRNNYDDLVANYNKLQAEQDKLLSSQNQDKAKDKKLAQ